MTSYADTSFLFSLFVPDANSAQAATLLQTLGGPIAVSPLSQLELGNAISLAVFRRRLDLNQAVVARGRVRQDMLSGALIVVNPTWDEAYKEATFLSLEQTPLAGCRSLDLLQVGIAKAVGADAFLSFDLRQRKAAEGAGLNVQPSEVISRPRSAA